MEKTPEQVRRTERAAFFLLKSVQRAVREAQMIRPDDGIAVGVSGGKDSLALLTLLLRYREISPVPFRVAAVHVSADGSGALAHHAPLLDWLAGIPGLALEVVAPETGPEESLPLTCQRCSWLRRKTLFQAADRLGCNVVALAHHADDAAQTTLLNLLYGGAARSFAAHAHYFGGKLRLIRPLVYTPESDLRRFAELSGFPSPPPACPRAGGSRRATAREMLRLLGRDYLTQARPNLVRVGLAGAIGNK